MDKRFQVFVSSTFTDLREARFEVIQALLELDCIPAGMELFPASDEAKWSLIKRIIDDCDYYVVIIAGRYGSLDGSGISYTEREYDYAVERGIPVLGFVHDEPGDIAVNRSDTDQATRAKLNAFRDKVSKKMCRGWRTPQELGGVVSRGIVQAMKRFPAEGWVRGRHAHPSEKVKHPSGRNEHSSKDVEKAPTELPGEALRLAKSYGLRLQVGYYVKRHGTRTLDSVGLSFDEIIWIIGPSMYDEAPESELRRLLAAHIAPKPAADDEFETLEILDHDFHTIKIQLLAFGIIQKSVRKHGLKDRETYWSLTPYGEQYTMELRIIRLK